MEENEKTNQNVPSGNPSKSEDISKTPDTFMDRLKREKSELDYKRDKLNDFQNTSTFNSLPAVQQSLLNVQAHAMTTYSQCLLERLTWLSSEEEHKVPNKD